MLRLTLNKYRHALKIIKVSCDIISIIRLFGEGVSLWLRTFNEVILIVRNVYFSLYFSVCMKKCLLSTFSETLI